MKRFDRSDENTVGLMMASERLQSFTKALWDALVPRSGACASVHGELVRANGRLQGDYFGEGLENYYACTSDRGCDGEKLEQTLYGGMLLFMLDTLIANRGAALDEEDVAYFEGVRRIAQPNWLKHHRVSELENKCEESQASEAEIRELQELEEAGGGLDWEGLFRRAERCIANWCIANPELMDRDGRPIEEDGVRRVEHIFEPPAPPPPCPLCEGRGWLPPKIAGHFPEFCSCKKGGAVTT